MDFEATRKENDTSLLDKISGISSGENIKVLVPFAKAYLGMYYVIDAELSAAEKVNLLANHELADAILTGLVAAIKQENYPSLSQIAEAQVKRTEFAEGYVLLAGLDQIYKQDKSKFLELDKDIHEAAIGFYYSNKCPHQHSWMELLRQEKKSLVISAYEKYWTALLKNNVTFLPGRNLVLGDDPDVEILSACILPLLENWRRCKVKTLFQLLLLAFQYADEKRFLEMCERRLANDKDLNEKTKLYWVATVYLLEPGKYFALLNNYVGRVKLKVMPLLDFISALIRTEDKVKINISDATICQLLKIIAPVFPPQHHDYGVLHGLDINSRNVMTLYYRLATSDSSDVVKHIKSLRKARVMKIYSDVLDHLLEIQMRKNNEDGFVVPVFEDYVSSLVDSDRLHGRSNRFD